MWKLISYVSFSMILIQLFFLILFYNLTQKIAPEAVVFIIAWIGWFGYSLHKLKKDENG
jgi:ABC-type multidrug transport system permease subunit